MSSVCYATREIYAVILQIVLLIFGKRDINSVGTFLVSISKDFTWDLETFRENSGAAGWVAKLAKYLWNHQRTRAKNLDVVLSLKN